MTDYKTTLIADEGLQLKPYKDTVGKLTIGVGRNLADKGLSEAEAMLLLENDIKDAVGGAYGLVINFDGLSDDRKIVLVSMVFQMGKTGVSKFRNMLRAINIEDFDMAAREMLDSRWAKQTPNRAERLSEMMKG